MSDGNYFVNVKVRGVIIHEGKLFLCRGVTNGGRGGFYCLPGGTLEPNEGRISCLEREILEELGVKPVIGKLLYTQELIRENGATTFDFWYEITNGRDFLSIDLSKCSHGFESSEVGFYDKNSHFTASVKPDDIWGLLGNWTNNERSFIQNA